MRQVNIVGTSLPSQPSRKIETLPAPPDVSPANVTLRTASETSLWLRWVVCCTPSQTISCFLGGGLSYSMSGSPLFSLELWDCRCVCVCVRAHMHGKHFVCVCVSFCPIGMMKNRVGTVLANLSLHVNWIPRF